MDLVGARRQLGDAQLVGQLAHALGVGLRGRTAGIELRLRDAAGAELGLVSHPLRGRELVGRHRLRQLRTHRIDLRDPATEVQVGQLCLGGLLLGSGLLARGRFIGGFQYEQRRAGAHRLAALHTQVLQPPAHRRGDIDELAFHVALVGLGVRVAATGHRRCHRHRCHPPRPVDSVRWTHAVLHFTG